METGIPVGDIWRLGPPSRETGRGGRGLSCQFSPYLGYGGCGGFFGPHLPLSCERPAEDTEGCPLATSSWMGGSRKHGGFFGRPGTMGKRNCKNSPTVRTHLQDKKKIKIYFSDFSTNLKIVDTLAIFKGGGT